MKIFHCLIQLVQMVRLLFGMMKLILHLKHFLKTELYVIKMGKQDEEQSEGWGQIVPPFLMKKQS